MSTSTSAATREEELTRLRGVLADAIAEAGRLGATQAEAAISTSAGLSVTVRLGEVETIEHTRDRSLGVTVYFDHRKGSASTTDISTAAVRESVAAACTIARHTAEDECAGLADAELMAVNPPDLDLFHPWSLDAEQAIAHALECENAAREADPRITNSEGASVSRHDGDYVYANTHGFNDGYASSRHSLSCTVIANDSAGMQRDYWYTMSRRPEDLQAPREVGEKAAERVLARLDARRIGTRTVPVVYAAEVASGLFGHFIGAIRGGSLYRRASFLLDHLGKQVFPDWMRIHEQPHLPAAIGSCPFDNEGVATRARDIVNAGVLQGYVLSSYSARKLGLQTTGNAGGVHNLTVEPGELDRAGLLREMGTGVLITELMGMGVNIVTGDYSRGAAGFWVENGEIAYPVEEITVAGNLRDMFRGIVAVGNDVDLRGNTRTGSVLIDHMTIAGQ